MKWFIKWYAHVSMNEPVVCGRHSIDWENLSRIGIDSERWSNGDCCSKMASWTLKFSIKSDSENRFRFAQHSHLQHLWSHQNRLLIHDEIKISFLFLKFKSRKPNTNSFIRASQYNWIIYMTYHGLRPTTVSCCCCRFIPFVIGFDVTATFSSFSFFQPIFD